MWIVNLVLWVLITYTVAIALKRIAKHNPLPAQACWAALGASLLVFLPSFNWGSVAEISPIWLNEAAEQQVHLVKSVTAQTLESSRISPFLLTLLVLFVPSLARLVRLEKRYQKAKQIIKSGASFDKHSTPSVVLPINQSPFVIGFLKPTIVLPHYFVHMNKQQQHTILSHEQTHIAKRDHIASWIWLILVEVFWFNPAIKRLNSLFINAMEQRCDRLTIAQHGLDKMDYVSTLLTSLKLSQQPISNPFVAQFNGQQTTLDEQKLRFSCIVNNTPISKAKIVLCFAFIALLIGFANYAFSHIATSNEPWQFPVDTVKVSSHYDAISAFRNRRPHRGTDFVDTKGSNILAARTGKVLIADSKTLPKGFGKTIVIQHSNGWQSLYAHLDEINVSQGQWVNGGDVIGKMGDTGRVTGTHLHFEVTHHGKYKNPLSLLSE